MNDELFKKDLIKHKVYTAWQFIEFTRKNIATVQYCKDTLTALIDNISKRNDGEILNYEFYWEYLDVIC